MGGLGCGAASWEGFRLRVQAFVACGHSDDFGQYHLHRTLVEGISHPQAILNQAKRSAAKTNKPGEHDTLDEILSTFGGGYISPRAQAII